MYAYRAPPQPAAPAVRLVPLVTAQDRAVFASLRVAPGQEGFVADNAESIAEADASPWCAALGVCDASHGGPVGFVMHALDPDDGHRWIYRLMIDARFQGRGFGRAALRATLAILARLPRGERVLLGVVPANAAARRLYTSEGFVETGETLGDELVMQRILHRVEAA
ncbi:GNAT family N-acetyltransferase [Inquilinus limosus]|uniref:GNAT family N-acetyltransferase n=1 Tax=Inquilinus limosus TaxID=171674 RepID=UPI003F14241F